LEDEEAGVGGADMEKKSNNLEGCMVCLKVNQILEWYTMHSEIHTSKYNTLQCNAQELLDTKCLLMCLNAISQSSAFTFFWLVSLSELGVGEALLSIFVEGVAIYNVIVSGGVPGDRISPQY